MPSHFYEPRAPGPLLMLLEGRAPLELVATLAATPWLKRAPQGDGHPVLVFPGLTAPDFTTLPLRKFIRTMGYVPHAWGQGFNLGPRKGVLDRCRERAYKLFQKYGEPVSLVGWSLGGVYAREIAKELPEQTRCVITLGTPFSGHPRANNAWRLYERVSGHKLDEAEGLIDRVRRPPVVPTTSIYSRTDGVVSWRCSLNDATDHTENIEVQASHCGMGMNPLVLYVLADRLAQDPADWQRFEVSGKRHWFFKNPSTATVSAGQRKQAA